MAARQSKPAAGAGRCGPPATAIAVESVRRRFPGREAQIDQLVAELSRGSALGTGCLVYGPAATGKTHVVRALLSALRVRHAYINCQEEATRTRPLLCSVLHQLKGGKRQRDDGYDTGLKCDSIADYRLQLPGVVWRASGSGRRGAGAPCWLVLDHAERLAGSDLLAALMRAREDTGAEVAVLLLSSVGWGSGRYARGTAPALPPKEVFFPAYRPEQLQKILEPWFLAESARQAAREEEAAQRAASAAADGGGKDADEEDEEDEETWRPRKGEAPAFRQFLTTFVPMFCRATNNLLDVQALARQLFPLYIKPLHEGQQLQSNQLYNRIRGHAQQRIQALQLQQGGGIGVQQAAATAGSSDGEAVGQLRTAAGRRACSSGLSFELPYISKFLLLAAYIASRNKPTADRAVFDPTYSKRARRDAQAHDRQVEAAVEAKLRGPHSFPLERLLHIFFAIYAHHDAEDDEGEDVAGARAGGSEAQRETQRVMQQAETLHQVSCLVSLKLLEECSGDVLEGQLYRCNLGEELAEALAANVKLRLQDYMKLA